ncbi:transposase zinc-binding domain-containing protein [Stigmatella hybrida]|uniref:transposase zinc-binding domain-containing protein n=1 Tax=Stigmatella hybrida TaxID=394097 RepID=UPI0037D9A790
MRCESGKDAFLVAFWCKGRGVCPSCNAKRAHVTAVHRVEQVLPHVPYRQWTLSFAHRVRWVLLKDVGLLSDVLTLFLRAGASPAATEGTAAGPTGCAGRGRVIHPVLRLRFARTCMRTAGRGWSGYAATEHLGLIKRRAHRLRQRRMRMRRRSARRD